MQMRTAASSLDELIGAGLLRRLDRACVVEVQYEEHTPEPYNPGLQSAGGRSGGARSTPPPPPRRRFETPPASLPAQPRPLADGHTQPIWPPPAAELARLTALAEQYAPPVQQGTLRFGTPQQEFAQPGAAPWADAAAAQDPTQLAAADVAQLTAAEPARLEMLPPRGPDFTLGPPLLPERAHDPYYYPGISDEPPAPEPPRARWHRWAAFAAGGLVLFGAGMIVRSLSVGSGGGAVIDVTPLDAKVTIDGEPIASASSPRVVSGLVQGEHTVEVERRGFLGQRRTFSLAEGEHEHRIEVTLLPEPVVPPTAAAPAQPAVAAAPQPLAAATAPAPAAAEPPRPNPAPAADGDRGKSDKRLSAHELVKQRRAERVAERYRERKAATAEAKAAKAAAKEAKASRADKAANAKADKAEAKEAKAARKADKSAPTAMLKLNSTPWSEVYVDDRHVGHTPLLGLPLTAGKHTIRLVNPTLGGSKTLKIRLKAGQTLTKIVQL